MPAWELWGPLVLTALLKSRLRRRKRHGTDEEADKTHPLTRTNNSTHKLVQQCNAEQNQCHLKKKKKEKSTYC